MTDHASRLGAVSGLFVRNSVPLTAFIERYKFD